ncbi:MAG: polysaccharide export protein [Pseudomonadales bacterium]|nr:polysaccharide export protein [Pseudomonadales bacterium]
MKNRNLIGQLPMLAVMLLSAVVLNGCTSQEKQVLQSAQMIAPSTTVPSDYMYLIGPGDSLSVFVWNNPEVSTTVTVRPDGMISTNLVEDLKVTGQSPTEAARQIEGALSKYIKEPIVTVIVGGFIGPYSEQVRILGEATSPQTLAYRQNMTMLDVMIAVGGITDFADGNDASIIRVVGGTQKQYSVRLNDLVRDGDISANVDMLPGDILIIPEAWF